MQNPSFYHLNLQDFSFLLVNMLKLEHFLYFYHFLNLFDKVINITYYIKDVKIYGGENGKEKNISYR